MKLSSPRSSLPPALALVLSALLSSPLSSSAQALPADAGTGPPPRPGKNRAAAAVLDAAGGVSSTKAASYPLRAAGRTRQEGAMTGTPEAIPRPPGG